MRVSDLVADLHSAVADTGDWESALARVSAGLGGARIIMGAVRSDRFGFAMQGHGVDADFLQSSAELLARPHTNPWMRVAPQVPLRRLVTEEDVAPREQLRNALVWEEFYRPLDLVESMGGVLERSASTIEVAMFGQVGRPFTPRERAIAGRLLPHLARAWRIRRALVHWQELAAGLASTLDHLSRGIIVTTPEGFIRFANRKADNLLQEGTSITATHGRVGAANRADAPRLQQLVAKAALAGQGAGPPPTAAAPLSDMEGGPPLVVMAEPITPPHCGALRTQAVAGAILFLGDGAEDAQLPAERLRHAYALTPAQAEVASRLIAGNSLVDAARALGISENTARTHLKAVFERVGVNRQADLVARALADVGGLASDAGHGPTGPALLPH